MSNTVLYTLPQWFVFAAVFVITYGWIEKKKPFRLVGYFILIALGLFSLIVLSGDYFAANNFLTPEEIAREELDDEIIDEVPFQAKLLPAYVSFVISALLSLPAIVLDVKNNNKYRWFIFAAGIVSLLGFFIIVGTIKSL